MNRLVIRTFSGEAILFKSEDTPCSFTDKIKNKSWVEVLDSLGRQMRIKTSRIESVSLCMNRN